VPFFLARDGVRLHYEVEGSGPPLILHLGAGADINLWRKAGYVEPLARSYTCVLFDHRGHGLSDHPTSVEANHLQRYVDDVGGLVEHLGHPSIAFFGWSNAVSVGLKVAQDRPGLLNALVLFGAIGRRATPEQIASSTATRVAEIREKGWRCILDDMVASEKFPVPQWFLDDVMATDVGPWLAFSQARPDWNWSIWDAMPQVMAPALYLAGELEDPDDLLYEAARVTPHATRIRIPEREHINAFLHSEYVVPRVLEFLAAAQPAQATG
jgi:pimeloyl-ACP methyl ester carboxylesterase